MYKKSPNIDIKNLAATLQDVYAKTKKLFPRTMAYPEHFIKASLEYWVSDFRDEKEFDSKALEQKLDNAIEKLNMMTSTNTFCLSPSLYDYLIAADSQLDELMMKNGAEYIDVLKILLMDLLSATCSISVILKESGLTTEMIGRVMKKENKLNFDDLLKDAPDDVKEAVIEEREINRLYLSRLLCTDGIFSFSEREEQLRELLYDEDTNIFFLLGQRGMGKSSLIQAMEWATEIPMYSFQLSLLNVDKYAMTSIGRIIQDVMIFVNKKEGILILEDANILSRNDVSLSDIINAISSTAKNIHFRGQVLITCTDETFSLVEKNLLCDYKKIQMIPFTKEQTLTIMKHHKKRICGALSRRVSVGNPMLETIYNYSEKYIHNQANPGKAIKLLQEVIYYCSCHEMQSVTQQAIANVLETYYKVNPDTINQDELKVYKTLKQDLKNIVKGQDEHIDKIVDLLLLSKSGLRESHKTCGNVFIKGSTGCGKTYFCQTLSKLLNIPLVRIDMTEFGESHTVTKLIGSSPGYLGYDTENGSGLLLQELSKTPKCIILLDEIEKAHPKVQNLFLQAMDNGSIRNSAGVELDFTNVYLFMTSNVGANEGNRMGSIGFGEIKSKASDNVFDSTFLPEFRGRLDLALSFNTLDDDRLLTVIKLELDKLNKMIADKNFELKFTDKDCEKILTKIENKDAGARSVKRYLETNIKVKLAEKIIFESQAEKNKILLADLI